MKFFQKIVSSLFKEYTQSSIEETNTIFEVKFIVKSFIPEKPEVSTFNTFQTSDKLICTVVVGSSDPISFYSEKNNFDDFHSKISTELEHQTDEEIIVTINVSKKTINGKVSIYDVGVFIKYLQNCNVPDFLTLFNDLLKEHSFITFFTPDESIEFSTPSICFTDRVETFTFESNRTKNSQIDKFYSSCHFSNSNLKYLIPSDFKIIRDSASYGQLTDLFNLYSVLLAIIFIFDITELEKNKLTYKLNGYKVISGNIDVQNINLKKSTEYYQIYDWIYEAGNFFDKIGLARNIISLHFTSSDNIDLQGLPFQSIQSSFQIYEKENIRQYIEIRSKISEQLVEFNQRASKIVDSFANGFQKSALALITFYISVMAIKLLNNSDSFEGFSLEATILSSVFIIGSAIYFFILRWDISTQRKRFEVNYQNLKARYEDLLDKEDINRILGYDKDYREDIAFIKKKMKYYSILWVIFLVLLSVATGILFILFYFSVLLKSCGFKILFLIIQFII